MRWVALEVFAAGEPNPFPDRTPAVGRRVRAYPVDQRRWLALCDFNGARTVGRLYDRRSNSIVGQVWVRRSVVRLRRAAWAGWLVLTVAAVVNVALRGNLDEDLVRDFSGEILVLLVAAILLFLCRLRAVIDREGEEVGVRGS